jgi:hypothetical protein
LSRRSRIGVALKSLAIVIAIVFVLWMDGCVRRDGRNSDCRWPAETSNQTVNARHLSADAEFAEDLAIRYADIHFGRHSPTPSENYHAERDACMERLFGEIGKEHGVPVRQVSDSLGRNRAYIDLAELLPFAVLYGLAAIGGAVLIWRRYPPAEDGWTSGIAMALFVSLAFAAISSLMGEVWNWVLEGYRIGNSHMSYRADRLFWHNHRLELFVAALMIFWLAAILAARRVRLVHSEGR